MTRIQKFAKHFSHDLTHSRYFQVYFVSWIIVVTTGLGSLAYFSGQITGYSDRPYQLTYTTTASSIGFPRFHFRSEGGQNLTLLSATCTHLTETVNTSTCNVNEFNSSCIAVLAGGIDATQKGGLDAQRIDCVITASIDNSTSYNTSVLNNLLAWELDNTRQGYFGPNSYSSIWIQPGTWAWVLLSPVNMDDGLDYERSLVYHGFDTGYGVTDPNTVLLTYQVSTIINSFTNWNYKSRQLVSGFNVAGLVGGFSFFLYIIHSIFMFLIGFSLDNDSIVLTGKHHDDDDKGETTSLLGGSSSSSRNTPNPPVPTSSATEYQDAL